MELILNAADESELHSQLEYQSAVGSLLYLSSATRPDITFAVNNVTKFSEKSTKEHWSAVKSIFRYLKGTVNYGRSVLDFVMQIGLLTRMIESLFLATFFS